MLVEDENEGGERLHMSHPLLAKLGVGDQIFFPLLAKEEKHFTLLVFKKNEKKWIFMDPFFNRQGADKSFHQAKTMVSQICACLIWYISISDLFIDVYLILTCRR